MSKKISELDSATELNNEDIFVIEKEGEEAQSVSKEVAFSDINEKVNNSLGTDEYDNTSTYSIGDYCINENALYKCTTAISIAENFNSDHWQEIRILDEIDAVKSKKIKIPTCKAIGSSEVTITTANTATKLPLSSLTYNNDSFSISNGGIKCPYAGTVLVTVSANMSPRTGYAGISIRNGNTDVGNMFYPSGGQNYGAIEASNKYVEVVSNDILYMYGQSSATNDKFQFNNDARAGMTVFYIKINE